MQYLQTRPLACCGWENLPAKYCRDAPRLALGHPPMDMFAARDPHEQHIPIQILLVTVYQPSCYKQPRHSMRCGLLDGLCARLYSIPDLQDGSNRLFEPPSTKVFLVVLGLPIWLRFSKSGNGTQMTSRTVPLQ